MAKTASVPPLQKAQGCGTRQLLMSRFSESVFVSIKKNVDNGTLQQQFRYCETLFSS
jgi:hypothetical protein